MENMAAPRIRCNYDEMGRIAHNFAAQSQTTRQLIKDVATYMGVLQDGDWRGKGAEAFYQEMSGTVLPGLNRLAQAFETGQAITQQVSAVMHRAELEAKRALDWNQQNPGGPGNSPGSGGANTGGSSAPSGGPVASSGSGTSGSSGPTGNSFIDGVIDHVSKAFKIKGKQASGESSQFGVDLGSGAVKSDKFASDHGKWELGGGTAGVGLRKINGKWMLGAAGEAYGGRVKVEGAMVGDRDLGWTGGVEAKALSASGFVGYQDGSVGGKVGVNLISAKAETGVNVAGWNVGVSGEIGLKLELGFQVGKKTEIKLGPFSVGFNIGDAKK